MSDALQKLAMPKWGLSMTEGKVVEWLVDEDAELAPGQAVADVETEKINGSVEAPAAGVLRRRVADVGDVVPVGGLLAVIATTDVPDADVDAFVSEIQATFVPAEAEAEASVQPETVTVETGALRFVRHGEGGEPLVLLHGYGGDLNNWLFNAEALSAERAVYALDLPGHGGSVKQLDDWDLGPLVGALRDFLDSQGIERAHLIGHSTGGLVAAALALEDPDRVLSLALVCPAGLGEEIDRDYIDGFAGAGSRRELKPVLARLFADPGLVTRQMVDDVLKYKRIDGVQEALGGLAGALFPGGRQRHVLAGELGSYPGPLLVVWGERDQIIPAAHARRAPPGAELHVLPDVGHSPHMEAAGDVNRLLSGFLAGVPASRAEGSAADPDGRAPRRGARGRLKQRTRGGGP